MTCWHDPRGRRLVDGYGRSLGRTVEDRDEEDRIRNAGMLGELLVTWVTCGWVPECINAPPCDGLRVILPSRRYSTGERMAPHECRSQRRWPGGET